MKPVIPGDTTFFEVTPTKNGKKIIIYLSEVGNNIFNQSSKCFGKYYLEQEFDKDNHIISEVIKENPHYIEDPYGDLSDDDDEWE